MIPAEVLAHRLAARKMGLIKDPQGQRLPEDLWRQALPEAEFILDVIGSSMIQLRRRTPLENLLRLIPAVRRRQDAGLEAAIKKLVENPHQPCAIDGRIIWNGLTTGTDKKPVR